MTNYIQVVQKKYFLGLFMLLLLVVSIPIFVNSISESKQIKSFAMFDSSSEINRNSYTYITPLNISETINFFAIDGTVALFGKDAFLRIVLVDNSDKEYLVYETNVSMTDQNKFLIENECDETCNLNKIQTKHLRIEGKSSSFVQSKLTTTRNNLLRFFADKPQNKAEKDMLKISKLNETIKKKGLKWTAGETEISKLTYEDKKRLFRDSDGKPAKILPNLQGFEYYVGGIFEIQSSGATPTPPSQTPTPNPTATPRPSSSPTATPTITPISPYLVEQWDWRDRHGKNWVSPIKNQLGCGSCWAFASIGTTESMINLYYNQILNIDLSEQDSVCRHAGSCVNGGFYSDTFNELMTDGLVVESCYPYVGTETCVGRCANYESKLWKITNAKYINVWPFNENVTKDILITKGPIPFSILSWWHIMTLVGYEKDLYSGQTIWIVKNSWGTSWGDNGFGKVIVPQSDTYSTAYIEKPYLAYPGDQDVPQILCSDNDGDNYCNWGISTNKPSSCSPSCLPQKDCDDSNSNLGTYDIAYRCININGSPSPTSIPTFTPVPTSTPTATPTSIPNIVPKFATDQIPTLVANRQFKFLIEGYDFNKEDTLVINVGGLPVTMKRACTTTLTLYRKNISCAFTGTFETFGKYTANLVIKDNRGGIQKKTLPVTVLPH